MYILYRSSRIILWDYFIQLYSTIIISMHKKEGIKLKIIMTKRVQVKNKILRGPKLLLSHIPFYKNNSFSLLKGINFTVKKHTFPSHVQNLPPPHKISPPLPALSHAATEPPPTVVSEVVVAPSISFLFLAFFYVCLFTI